MTKKTIDDLRSASFDRLDVYVKNKKVAILAKEHPNFVLSYLPDASPDDFVSLSMPVRVESWVSHSRLHPFFEINLPEGERRRLISETFGKAMTSEDMSLLALVGSDTIGRVTVVPEGFPVGWRDKMSCDVNEAAHSDTDAFFNDAISKYSAQGVSGVQPKVLALDKRLTIKADGWIIKRDGIDMPGLSMNEHLSMVAARASGVNVAETMLSDDGKALYVKRFDSADVGFEDFCGMMGLSPVEKYSGSMEKIAKIAQLVVADRPSMKEDLLRIILFNLCIGNSDAHLKNFGVTYTGMNDVSLSPFYDLVSVRSFDEFKNDIPSLTINGKKEWVAGKAFHAFAAALGVNKSTVAKIMNEVSAGVQDSIPNIILMAEKHPEFREQAKRMIASWTTGVHRIHGEKISNDDFTVLPEYGMSGPKFEVKVRKPNPYKSTMGGF